jgi:hypothetical protein
VQERSSGRRRHWSSDEMGQQPTHRLLAAALTQESQERPHREREISSTGIVEEVSVVGRAPVLKDSHDPGLSTNPLDLGLEDVAETDALEDRIQNTVHVIKVRVRLSWKAALSLPSLPRVGGNRPSHSFVGGHSSVPRFRGHCGRLGAFWNQSKSRKHQLRP